MNATKKDLTTGDIARYCRTTHFTVNGWIRDGKLRAYKTLGGHHRIVRDDFLAFLSTHHLPVPDDFAPRTTPRILVVGHDRTVAQMLTQARRQEGYQLSAAIDEYDVGLKMATFKPQLLLLDLSMSHVNGLDLCARVKRDPLTQDVKIIAMTSYAQEEAGAQALAARADACLQKPFHLKQLLREVRRLLHLPGPGGVGRATWTDTPTRLPNAPRPTMHDALHLLWGRKGRNR